jgi:hypothetical protein
MTFFEFIEEINNIENYNPIEITNKFFDKEMKNLKFDLDEKLNNEQICFKYSSYNIIHVDFNMKEIRMDNNVLKSKLNTCRFLYLILAMKSKNGAHIASLTIDNKEKQSILFDNGGSDEIKYMSKVILKKLELKYKLVSSNIYSKKIGLCDICLPSAYLFIYSYIKFNVKLDKFIKFFNNKNLEFNTNVMFKFIKYLKAK